MPEERSVTEAIARYVRKYPAYGHFQRIEDSSQPGIPDINLCWGGIDYWIECKAIDDWPKRPATPVRTGLTLEQAAWLDTRHKLHMLYKADVTRNSFRVMLLLRVNATHEWVALTRDFRTVYAGVTKSRLLREIAEWTWRGRFIDFPQDIMGIPFPLALPPLAKYSEIVTAGMQ